MKWLEIAPLENGKTNEVRMKTKNLMEELAKCDPQENVIFKMISGCCGDHQYLEVSQFGDGQFDVEACDYKNDKKETKVYLSVVFNPVPGYRSCIQAGGTIEADKKYWEKFYYQKDKKNE